MDLRALHRVGIGLIPEKLQLAVKGGVHILTFALHQLKKSERKQPRRPSILVVVKGLMGRIPLKEQVQLAQGLKAAYPMGHDPAWHTS